MCGAVFGVALLGSAAAQEPPTDLTQNLEKLSIEELTQLDVTTASRRRRTRSHAGGR